MGGKNVKSAQTIVLKPSVTEQILERDKSLQRIDTLGKSRESEFDADGELIGADLTVPSSPRLSKDRPRLGTRILLSRRDRPSVTNIEVTHNHGKVGLRYINYQHSSKPVTTQVSQATSPSPRSILSLSPRSPISSRSIQTSSPLLTPRHVSVLKEIDPSIKDLFVSRPYRQEGGIVTLRKTLWKPKQKEEEPVSQYECETRPDGVVCLLQEAIELTKSASDSRLQRRAGVRFIASPALQEGRSPLITDPRLSALVQLLRTDNNTEENTYVRRKQAKNTGPFRRLSQLMRQKTGESTGRSRAEKQWKWRSGKSRYISKDRE